LLCSVRKRLTGRHYRAAGGFAGHNPKKTAGQGDGVRHGGKEYAIDDAS
jgi:hypothetical protein